MISLDYLAMPPFSVNTVFFDSAGTLVEVPPYSRVWHRIMGDLGLDMSLHRVEVGVRYADSAYGKRYLSYAGRTRDYWTSYLGFLLAKLKVEGNQSELAEEICERFEQRPWSNPYPETKGVLRALKRRGFKLGVISNATDDVTNRLEHVGLAEYFDSFTYSQEARAEKPHPRIFRLALERSGCKPIEAVHVGDSYDQDVLGAKKVGMQPILVDRQEKTHTSDCPSISNLQGIQKLIRLLREDQDESPGTE